MSKKITFKVGGFLNGRLGESQNYSFEGPVDFEHIAAKSPLSAEVKLLKTDDGIFAEATDVDLTAELQCDRCLRPFEHQVHLKSVAREFLIEPPAHIEDPEDLFLIDMKNQEIDIADMLRQEIILHFPQVPVCYEGCKGICAHCGVNKNDKSCNCKDTEEPKNKPLSALKDLIK